MYHKQFKKGDLVRGNSEDQYFVTTSHELMRVIEGTNRDGYMSVEVIDQLRSSNVQFIGGSFTVQSVYFDLTTEVYFNSLKKTTKSTITTKVNTNEEMKETATEQQFIESIPVALKVLSDYWDEAAEEWDGCEGIITHYNKYESSEGCWSLFVSFDSDVVEVLESELNGYQSPVKGRPVAKTATSKAVTTKAPEARVQDSREEWDYYRTTPSSIAKVVPVSRAGSTKPEAVLPLSEEVYIIDATPFKGNIPYLVEQR